MIKKKTTRGRSKGKKTLSYDVKEVDSILDAFNAAIEILQSWGGEENIYCWFRGVKSNKLGLVPGAHWRTAYDERGPLLDFCQQGVRFTKLEGLDSWSTYYLAQHHGIPTRLLDWSESFISSCFFAFDGATKKDIPCVWLLDPCEFNSAVCGWYGVVSPEYGTDLKIWLPSEVNKPTTKTSSSDQGSAQYDNNWPLAIYPRQDNIRIQTQKGFFTVHGRDKAPIDAVIASKHPNPKRVLARIDFKKCDKRVAIKQLELLGTRRSSIYPDMDNFVRELKSLHNW